MVTDAAQMITAQSIRNSFQHCGFHLVDNNCFNYFVSRLNEILRSYVVLDNGDEDWDNSENTMYKLGVSAYKHASLFNAEAFEKPCRENAFPHYVDSIETVMQIAKEVESDYESENCAMLVDYNAETVQDKLARWDATIEAVVKFEEQDHIELDNHYKVFEFF